MIIKLVRLLVTRSLRRGLDRVPAEVEVAETLRTAMGTIVLARLGP
ncbi:MAG TPA: hypothetical protein VLS92_08440 [Acidimicrobiia bacterium]|nr:hypothetical protein [Acidimicrobiia bacterium]